MCKLNNVRLTIGTNATNYQSIKAEEGREIHAYGRPPGDGGENPHPDDHLAPPFDSDDRPSNLFVGAFNLIATIVGGGVLSLPVVFERCGVAFTTVAMILSACTTYAGLIMLCFCSRRGGGSSYGEVVRGAFGERMEEGMSWILFVFLVFVIIAYMVLIRDIWTPLVRQVAGNDDVDGDHVLLVITVLMLPFMFQRSLHALRYNCYVGSGSIFVLCLALCRGGWQRLALQSSLEDKTEDLDSDLIQAWTQNESSGDFAIDIFKVPSPRDLLFSFPIITCAFLCHFNIIAIQNALVRPTRDRIQKLTGYAVGACFLLMYAFGLGGYLYGGRDTRGNILLNVPMAREEGEDEGEYYMFLLGRVGCGITIMFATPMMALPCREALLEVVDVRFHGSHHTNGGAAGGRAARGSEAPWWRLFRRCNKSETVEDAAITTEDELLELTPEGLEAGSSVLIRRGPIQGDYVFRNTLAHYGSTLTIAATCYLGATAVSGVAAVWSFIGSSMAFLIGFVLPCGCFVVIEGAARPAAEGGDRRDGWIRVGWALLIFSIAGALVCTVTNALALGR